MAWFQTQTRTRICFTLCNACSSLLPNSRNHCALTARWSMPTFICAQGFAEPLRCRRSLHALLMPNFFASSGIAQRSQVRIFMLAASIMMLLGPMHGKRTNFWCITTRIIQKLPWLAPQKNRSLAATKQKDGTEKGQTKLPAGRDLRFRALRHTHLC